MPISDEVTETSHETDGLLAYTAMFLGVPRSVLMQMHWDIILKRTLDLGYTVRVHVAALIASSYSGDISG